MTTKEEIIYKFKHLNIWGADKKKMFDLIEELLSQQKQEMTEGLNFTQYDADDIMNILYDGDWEDPKFETSRFLADLINVQIKRKLNK